MLGSDKFKFYTSVIYLSDKLVVTGGEDVAKKAFYYLIKSRS